MLLDHPKRYATWLKGFFKAVRIKQRRRIDKETAANRLGLWSGLVVAVVSVSFSAVGAWNVLELQSYNLLHQARQALFKHPQWDDQIVVIAIDEDSVARFGQFPWSRNIYAELLDQLWVAQPAAVSFDILFPEATGQDARFTQSIVDNANIVLAVGTDSQGEPLEVTDQIAGPAEGFFLQGDAGHRTDADGISRQINLFNEAGTPSLTLATLQVYAQTMANTAKANASALNDAAQGDGRALQGNRLPKTHSPSAYFSQLQPEGAQFEQPARLPAPNTAENTAAPGAAIEQTERPMATALAPDQGPVLAPDAKLPERLLAGLFRFSSHPIQSAPERWLAPFISTSGPIWLNWPGPVNSANHSRNPGELAVYPFVDVVDGRIDTSLFRNKIVLIGTTLAGQDPLRTPLQTDPPLSGVYFYAAAIDNLLNQSFLRRPPTWQNTLLLAVLALGGSHLLRRQGVYGRLAIVVFCPVLWSALAFGSFLMGWWLPVAAPIGTLMLSALAIQLHEQQEKQQLMALFSMNVSPGTAELIWRHKGEILNQGELAAQKLTATVLFMDIRGFTTIAETLPSQQLLPWLNQYFETMTDCIMEHGGMVDKYIGDAIMAVFGAPLPRTRPEEIKADAIAAVQAAMEMHERLKSLNLKLRSQRLPTIKFGIGIHTGPLVGGTVGNRHRLNYSLFGDTVNIAARLEALTKVLPEGSPFKLLLSAETYRHTQTHFPAQLVKSTQLRGREGHTDLYTVAPPTAPACTLVPYRVAKVS